MTNKLRIRHSTKPYANELLAMLCDVVECYRDQIDSTPKAGVKDWYDLRKEALRYAKVYDLSSVVIWFSREIRKEPLVPVGFKSLANLGTRSAFWRQA